LTGRSDAALIRQLKMHQVPHVVIGGWAVIAHGYIRTTRDVDVLVPDDSVIRRSVGAALYEIDARTLRREPLPAEATMPDQGWQLETIHGRIDLLLEGAPPLDFESVHRSAMEAELDGEPVLIADLAHLVAFKRLAGRLQDRADLAALERLHGHLPIIPVPGLDTPAT
jgi:hypothetical protein